MKVLLLTGGSRGLGLALLEIFEAHSWTVLEFSRTGATRWNHPMDLAEPGESLAVFQRALDRIDPANLEEIVMIHNAAAIHPIRRVSRLTPEEINAHLNTNVSTAFLLCQEFLRRYRRLTVPKTLVNIGSGAANKGYPGWSLYCTGKAAMENFVRAVHEEEKTEEDPFRVLTFDPHVMDTEMQETIRASAPEDFPQVSRFLAMKEEGRLSPPEEVAESLYLLLEKKTLSENRYAFGS